MKKTLSVLCLLAAFLVFLPLDSFGSSKKEMLVGKWEYSMNVSQSGVDAKINGTYTFNNDGSYMHDFVMPIQDEEDGMTVSMTVKGYQSGKWNLVGDVIYITNNGCDAKLIKANVYNEWIGTYDATSSDLKELENDFLPGLLSALSEDETDEIAALTPTILVLKSDGETITLSRVKQ